MSEQAYIKMNAVYQKLQKAEAEQRSIYIHAPVGTGKTAAARYYYRNKVCRWFTGEAGYLPDMPELSQIKTMTDNGISTFIIDDVSWITDQTSCSYICNLVQSEAVHVVLLGRSRMPAWLLSEYAESRLLTADERDMLLGIPQLERMFKICKCPYTREELEQILADTQGFALELRMLIPHILMVGGYSQAVLAEARLDCFRYYNQMFFDKWDSEVQNMLLAVAEFDRFDEELATFVSGNGNVPKLLEYAYDVGDFLVRNTDESYSFRPKLTDYLLWKRSVTWKEASYRSTYEGASRCYEVQGNIEKALAMAKKIPDEDRITELLIKNARQHPGTGHYYETKEYYFALPEEKIMEVPILIAGMSMLYSLLLQPKKSEQWYEKLVQFVKDHKSDPKRCADARNRIAYLDIALPHRGMKEVATILKSVSKLCISRDLSLPEFSVTSNLPGIMNGGKDFCDWSRIDKELAVIMRKPIEIVLKEYGVGLVDIALAESCFEKGEMDDYSVLSLLNNGYSMAEAGGKIEICYASIGIQVKQHVARGNLNLAEKQLRNFRAKAVKEEATQLLSNIDAQLTWLELLKGNLNSIKEWLTTAPDETQEFYILDRYQYLIKLRCYMALGEYETAWSLSERLAYYFANYGRHYMEAENKLLRAIISYRTGREWTEIFKEAYEIAKSYHFVWLIAQEGMAVLPLLRELESEDTFLLQLKKKVEQMTFWYPNYMEEDTILEEPLTEMEKRILQLHAGGKTTRQIKELCKITDNTLKFHNKNIYKKLDAKNKSEAVQTARKHGLVNS